MMRTTMIKIKFTGGGELRAKLSNLENKMLTRKLMKKLSLQGITEIFENTVEEGRDKNNKSFTPYSKSYIEKKKERGGKFFSSNVNLFDKGHMMGNLDHKVLSRSSAFLHFPKIEERLKASGHIKGQGTLSISSHKRKLKGGKTTNVKGYTRKGLPQRDFFGLNRSGEAKLIEMVDDHIKELTSGQN